MTRWVAMFFALAVLAISGQVFAGGRCPYDIRTAESRAPATTADGAGAAPMTSIPLAPPATGG